MREASDKREFVSKAGTQKCTTPNTKHLAPDTKHLTPNTTHAACVSGLERITRCAKDAGVARSKSSGTR